MERDFEPRLGGAAGGALRLVHDRERRLIQKDAARGESTVIIRVVAYDSRWPALYAAEARRLREALRDVVSDIHHIGSTAVPGLSAKPIIDILLAVSSLAKLDERASILASLGYEAKGEHGIPGRRYFRRDDERGERTHQVHSFQVSSGEADRHLAFRDCLISHPQVAEEYAELKRGLARRFPSDIYGYMDGKNAFVKHHEARALEWRAGPARTSEESGEACTWKGGVLPVRSLDNDSVTCEEN
jgi:GrpB-like predicted nucleotidyltransferase (UPF0157 family)